MGLTTRTRPSWRTAGRLQSIRCMYPDFVVPHRSGYRLGAPGAGGLVRWYVRTTRSASTAPDSPSAPRKDCRRRPRQ